MTSAGITTGVLGGRWRATVTPWGAIEPWPHHDRPDEPTLDWHIAADDRWHSPRREAAVRQARVEGTAVVETRVRIPNGDAVQRVYSVPEHGGLTIIEVENASPLSIAVVFTRGDLLSARVPSAPIEGIDVPVGSVAFPVGHHASVTVALSHSGNAPGVLPARLTPFTSVVRGWSATVDRAGRMLLPDPLLCEQIISGRCELALCGPAHPDDNPVAFLLGVGQLVRMGELPEPWTPDVAHALEVAAKHGPRDWALAAAFDAADGVFAAARDPRARADAALMRRRLAPDPHPGVHGRPAEPTRSLAWAERRLATPTPTGVALLPQGIPAAWAGTNFEVYGLANGSGGTISYAVRWHGARPAVLWEQAGQPVEVTSPLLAPAWSAHDLKGETLWPEPALETESVETESVEGVSFKGVSVDGESFS